MTAPPAGSVTYAPVSSVGGRPKPSLRARIAAFGLSRTLDFAAWRHRRQALHAERRGRSDQVFHAFVQINVNPRVR